jgi:hypothetical protein
MKVAKRPTLLLWHFNDLGKVAAAYPLSPTNTKHQCNTGIRFEFVLDLF